MSNFCPNSARKRSWHTPPSWVETGVRGGGEDLRGDPCPTSPHPNLDLDSTWQRKPRRGSGGGGGRGGRERRPVRRPPAPSLTSTRHGAGIGAAVAGQGRAGGMKDEDDADTERWCYAAWLLSLDAKLLPKPSDSMVEGGLLVAHIEPLGDAPGGMTQKQEVKWAILLAVV